MEKLFIFMFIAFFAWRVEAVTALKNRAFLFEVAPLRLTFDHVSVRSEVPVYTDWTAFVSYDQRNGPSDKRDRMNALQVGGQWYLPLFKDHGPYAGMGAGYVSSTRNYSSLRPAITYYEPDDGSAFDRWEANIQDIEAHILLGYRYLFDDGWTASVRYQTNRSVLRATTIESPGTLKSEDELLNASQIPRVRRELAVFLGMAF